MYENNFTKFWTGVVSSVRNRSIPYPPLGHPYTELAESGTVYLHDTNPNQTSITKGL